MAARSTTVGDDRLTVWERGEPLLRPAPLSRHGIVAAATAIADAEGLASVSLRKVGAALGAGPMRLYGYVATKDELLDLMVDAVYAEMTTTVFLAGGWRTALRAFAAHMRLAAERHPWFVDLLGGRPHQGPSALALLEAALSALGGEAGFRTIGGVMQAIRTVNAYVIGALGAEAAERRAGRETGLDKAGWQAAASGYLLRMIATGRFPMLEKVVQEHDHPPAERVFEQGLECVLDGIAMRLAGDLSRRP
jgi:AcrR family transcriptional regulator